MVFLTPILAWWNPNGYFRKISKSAADIYNASFDETTWGKHPKSLYLDGNVPSGSSPETRDESKQKRLWDYSVQLTGIKANETNVKLT